MARSAGRDQVRPMERLIRILIGLTDAGDQAVPVERLLRLAGFAGDTDVTRAQLRRDLQILRQGGWEITNVATDGADASYRLRVHDNRLTILLDPGERAALRALLVLEHIDRAAPPPFLGTLHHAIRDRSLVTFAYTGRERVVHPDGLYATPSGWVLAGREVPEQHPKEFVTAWMGEVAITGPGRATEAVALPVERVDPLLWQLDPPERVRVGVLPDFVGDALRLLPGARVVDGGPHADEMTLELVVTNQATFRARLYSLGLRVRAVSPPDLVERIVDNLRAVAGGSDGALR